MKRFILAATLFSSLKLSAQEKPLFDTTKVDANTKLIGYYPLYDKQKTYQYLNFIIEDSATIKKALATLTLGKEVSNVIGNPDFHITMVQNSFQIDFSFVNPPLNCALQKGHSYAFDIDKVKELADKYPFDYKSEEKKFNTREEYDEYLKLQRENKSFLFCYSPSFKYEGSFEIQFPNNETFSSPKAISDYLKPSIEKIVSKDDYSIKYYLSEKNKKYQDQYTMTIDGSKKLFDELQPDHLKKQNWKPSVATGTFFYRID
ncbi:hypothetical protein [Pinibacter soli]|uniref:Uncharacterized protein n=1 Tax=Pinibacter soli TaxID=3044211 RepID=A0ABT6RFX0_9BACT|nr:hypothetical protein [Pinibacter soli]MDI3321462.1 hypothetical protein [Pinibacter soli]